MTESKFKTWIKNHKTELIVAGGAILTTLGAIALLDTYILNSKKMVLPPPTMINEEVHAVPVVESEPIIKTTWVRMHPRNLPSGHHPSVNKLLEATEFGVELTENQTLVSAYSRRCVA